MAKIKKTMTSKDRLKLQQLRIAEWFESWQNNSSQSEGQKTIGPSKPDVISEKWCLSKGVELYEWQQDCVNSWFNNNLKGTVKVVTGAGKTMLALAIAERLQNTVDTDLRIVIVVPTIVLMHQWYDEINEKGNIPETYIGRLGGGYNDDFSNGKRILITVLVSASRKLNKIVQNSAVGPNLLLIADECHRTGAAERKSVLNVDRKYSLGLSATPERDDNLGGADDNSVFNNSELGLALGKIIYELTYAEALHLGIIPPFTIYHYGLPLDQKEKTKYESLTRSIKDLKQELKYQAPAKVKTEGDFWSWVRSMAGKEGGLGFNAGKLQGEVKKRKDLIYGMNARNEAVIALLKKEFSVNKNAQVLLFHESIKDAMDLYFLLKKANMPVIVEHSQLTNSIRERGLDLFRKGDAKILVSVKSLIEGFNVPAVDVGIIVASSSSPRQRIQSMGRVMRKHRNQEGEEQTSKICILYADKTVDESIYGKLNWEEILGAEANLYYKWSPGQPMIEQTGPPLAPKAKDNNIDVAKLGLKPGDEYPGAYEGDEFSCDTQKNISNKAGQMAVSTENLGECLLQIKGPGKFRVTPGKLYVLVRIQLSEEKWVTKYISTLTEAFKFDRSEEKLCDKDKLDEWLLTATAGSEYPFNSELKLKLKFSKKKGGTICKKVSNGEVFARTLARAEDPEKGKVADCIIQSISQLFDQGKRVSIFEINQNNHAVFRMGGKYCFICKLDKELEFPK